MAYAQSAPWKCENIGWSGVASNGSPFFNKKRFIVSEIRPVLLLLARRILSCGEESVLVSGIVGRSRGSRTWLPIPELYYSTSMLVCVIIH